MNRTASQASHEKMEWERVSKFAISSDEGYLIRVQEVNDAWVYLAYGPHNQVKQKGGRMMFEDIEYKERYEIGEEVPPQYNYKTKKASRDLGGYHSSTHGSPAAALAAAKGACELHRQHLIALHEERVLPTPCSNGGDNPRGSASDSAVSLPNT